MQILFLSFSYEVVSTRYLKMSFSAGKFVMVYCKEWNNLGIVSSLFTIASISSQMKLNE